jgi:hypothetical protein
MRVHGIEWKKWPAFAPMKHGQWRENSGVVAQIKEVLLMLNLFTVAFIERLWPLEKCRPF